MEAAKSVSNEERFIHMASPLWIKCSSFGFVHLARRGQIVDRLKEIPMWCKAGGGIVTFTLSLLAVLLTAAAQPVATIPRIGVLSAGFPPAKTGVPSAGLDAFRQELRDLGYVEGQTIVLEERWAEGQVERFPALAAKLVGLPVDIIVSGTAAGIRAA
jgi:hypothetical protein